MVLHSPTSILNQSSLPQRTIRPMGVGALHGITFLGNKLLAVDPNRGMLLQIDPKTDNTIILNPYQTTDFLDTTGLAVWHDTLWFCKGDIIFSCPSAIKGSSLVSITPEIFLEFPYRVDGIAVWQSTLYLTSQERGYIFVFDRDTRREITRFYAPGIGLENLAVRGEELWICDRTEQTVYCLERGTGETRFSVITPFESPTGLAFQGETLYVAYASDELYIREDPNAYDPFQLGRRDRTFIHSLSFVYNQEERYTLSNGFLIEMSYMEELEPLDEIHLEDLEWRIALPSNTHRQKVREISYIGTPFTEEIEGGERIAVFKFDTLHAHERRFFGWKALLEVRGIKYQLKPSDLEKAPPLSADFPEQYLIDNDHLSMQTDIIKRAAVEAIGSETNLLRKLLSIRDYVYDQLSYAVTSKIDPPDIVLKRGVGSCGEYVGVLLALSRLNGIASRTIGRYKCPPFPERKNIPLEPDFNHVWLEFYFPGFGWVPMESNPDDIQEGGPYPLRFFMGLAWYHVEIGKGIRFQRLTSKGVPLNKEQVSVGTLAINHVRFTILDELPAKP